MGRGPRGMDVREIQLEVAELKLSLAQMEVRILDEQRKRNEDVNEFLRALDDKLTAVHKGMKARWKSTEQHLGDLHQEFNDCAIDQLRRTVERLEGLLQEKGV